MTRPGPARAANPRADDGEYLTTDDFAALPSAAQHAVWKAHRDGLVDAVPASPKTQMLRYNRAQVAEILRELAAPRG